MEETATDKAKSAGAAAGDARLLVGLEVEVGGDTGVVHIYLDSGVLVALFDPDDMHHDDAVRAFRAIARRGYMMVTSLLAVMEAVAVVRKKAARSHRCGPEGAEEMAGVEARVEDAAGGMARFVANMVNEGLLRVMDSKGWSPDLELLYGKLLEHTGHVVPATRGSRFRHRAVGSCDWLHIWLAWIFGAEMICTTDTAFADIPGRDDRFGGIAVQLTSAPLSGLLA